MMVVVAGFWALEAQYQPWIGGAAAAPAASAQPPPPVAGAAAVPQPAWYANTPVAAPPSWASRPPAAVTWIMSPATLGAAEFAVPVSEQPDDAVLAGMKPL